ncbi:hypothetical protein ILYODFUR_034741 [Ilyodon furcidens]|uniref:Uncharacterized protein n=1 Tax=Ilyodon furcidens TaxID=33524 RepID=A0ABV0TPD2_9TELE
MMIESSGSDEINSSDNHLQDEEMQQNGSLRGSRSSYSRGFMVRTKVSPGIHASFPSSVLGLLASKPLSQAVL